MRNWWSRGVKCSKGELQWGYWPRLDRLGYLLYDEYVFGLQGASPVTRGLERAVPASSVEGRGAGV